MALAILLLFLRDVADMVSIWWTSSTYNHCLILPFLIGWLVHQRMDDLRRLEPVAWPVGLLWLAGGALLWLLGDAAGLAVLRHGGLIVMLQGAVAAMLGPAVTRGLLFPLFYAFFMVPVGSELEPALQLLTARIAMGLLSFAGVPAHIEGIFITTPTGYFEVAEACSGAKFLVAMAAYGVLVCNVCFRSWTRRALFLAGALTLSFLANGVRAFATIYVAHVTTIDAAVGFDHVVYGWLFFAVVMTIIMGVAWPFLDRRPGDEGLDVHALQGTLRHRDSLSIVAGAALAILVVAPLWSHMSSARAQIALAAPRLPEIPGWTMTDVLARHPWTPRFDGADHLVRARYANDEGHVVDLAIATYARQEEGRELIGFGQGVVDPDSDWVWSSPAWAPPHGKGERITAPGPVVREAVSFYRVGNARLSGAGLRVKFDTMTARLLMRDQRAVAIVISAEDGEGRSSRQAITAFLNALGNPEDLADAAVRTR